MGRSEVIIFLIAMACSFTVFVTGIVVFIYQFRKKAIERAVEKERDAQQYQQQLLAAQLDSQQQTMRSIGAEIHDSVGQKLTLASLYNKRLAIDMAEHKDSIHAVSVIIDESLAELKQLSRTLTNALPVEAGLVYLLNEEAKRVNAAGVCIMAVNYDQSELFLAPEKKNGILRLLQEFIQNSLKHSGCDTINIMLKVQEPLLHITAADNGKGFDTRLTAMGIGLQTMKTRADQLNATYMLNSNSGMGTVLTLAIETG